MRNPSKTQLVRSYFILFVISSVAISYLLHFVLLRRYVVFEILLALNVSSLVMFGYDKVVSAYEKSTRVPENFFFLISALGGSIGILVGSNMFRHKRQKMSFMGRIFLIVLVQIIVGWVLFELGLLSLSQEGFL